MQSGTFALIDSITVALTQTQILTLILTWIRSLTWKGEMVSLSHYYFSSLCIFFLMFFDVPICFIYACPVPMLFGESVCICPGPCSYGGDQYKILYDTTSHTVIQLRPRCLYVFYCRLPENILKEVVSKMSAQEGQTQRPVGICVGICFSRS